MKIPTGTYRHTNGNEYEVLAIANLGTERPDQYPVTVVYQNTKTGAFGAGRYQTGTDQ